MSKFVLLLILIFPVYTLGKLDGAAIQKAIQESDDLPRDILLLDPEMSEQYRKGSYLVYDCNAGHWVCTAAPEFKRCKLDRQYYADKGSKELGCAPIKKYKTNAVCIKAQVNMTNANMRNRFCLNDKERTLDIKY